MTQFKNPILSGGGGGGENSADEGAVIREYELKIGVSLLPVVFHVHPK